MPKVHTITFISDYGKIWSLDYTMHDRDTIGEILGLSVDGNQYHVTCFKREERILRLAAEHGADLYEHAAESHRETHHFVDN